MRQRSSVLKVVEPTSRRRSPRFLHLQNSPTTPEPTTNNPISFSSLTPQSIPNNVLPISRKKAFMSSNKSVNGFSNLPKSANGLKRITRLSGNVDGSKARRLSSRLTHAVNSSVDIHISINGKVDGSICRKSDSHRRSKKELNLMGKENLDSPVTPIIDGERKLIVGNRKEVDVDSSVSCSEFVVKYDKRITRSRSRLMGRTIAVGKMAEDRQLGCNLSKRFTRGANAMQSLVRRDCSTNVSSASLSRDGTRASRKGKQSKVTGNGKDGEVNDSCHQIVGNSYQRLTRSAAKNMGENGNPSRNAAQKAETVQEKQKCLRISEGGENATEDLVSKEMELKDCIKKRREERSVVGRGEKREHYSSKDTKLTGVKRKRNQIGIQGTTQGWTKEQEVALRKAYFTAKPSPHFWKKVAKLIPGKTAQECFDKVHSDDQTPVCSKPASRTRKHNSPSDFLVSGSKLFKSTEKSKSKKTTCKTKCKSQATRKTVRHLLQKYCHVNQNDEADLFSVLEPSVIPSSEAYQVTPRSLLKSPQSSSKSCDRSSSACMKRSSRFSNKGESPLMSPPVLKKMKNMAWFERYIDRYNVRDHKRNVAFSRCIKSAENQKGGESKLVQTDIIKAAKNALMSDAKDVIDKFRDSQAIIMEEFSEPEEHSDYDEDEIVL